jgi:hypothetical protein
MRQQAYRLEDEVGQVTATLGLAGQVKAIERLAAMAADVRAFDVLSVTVGADHGWQ